MKEDLMYATLFGNPISNAIFLDKHIAQTLLDRIIPSNRYGGLGQTCPSEIREASFQPRAHIEQTFRIAMGTSPAMRHNESLPALVRRTLECDIDPDMVTVSLSGCAMDIENLFVEGELPRSSVTAKPYPIFICSKGRSQTALLHWKAAHCLGSSPVPVVVVVEPQEEAAYRYNWPTALLLILPAAANTVIGYTRWVVQRICTCSYDISTNRKLCLPFIWMADDLLVAMYYLEMPFGPHGRRILAARPNEGFVEALVAVQQHEHVENAAVTGILRDRGLCSFIKQEWILDESLTLQKLVLLNIHRLRELGVEYCKYLRKSEDLALCYDVVQRQGGHVLKVQSYCYRAVHFEHGGADAIRAECKRNAVGTIGELIQGADLSILNSAHQIVAKALLQWLRDAQLQAIESRSDKFDESEGASQILLQHLRVNRLHAGLQPTAWLEPLRKMRRFDIVDDSTSQCGAKPEGKKNFAS